MKNRSSKQPALSRASRRASMNEPDVQSHSTSRSYTVMSSSRSPSHDARNGNRSERERLDRVHRDSVREPSDRREELAVAGDLLDADQADLRPCVERRDELVERALEDLRVGVEEQHVPRARRHRAPRLFAWPKPWFAARDDPRVAGTRPRRALACRRSTRCRRRRRRASIVAGVLEDRRQARRAASAPRSSRR